MDTQLNKLNSLITNLLDVTMIESGKLQFKQILSLTKELNAAGTENIDWLYDDAKFNAYKDRVNIIW